MRRLFKPAEGHSPKVPAHEPTVMSRAMGGLFIGGAAVGLASLALPAAPHADRVALLSNIAIACAAGLALLTVGHRARLWMFHPLLAGGTLIVTRAIYYSGTGVSYYSAWYVWVALFAFYFFRPRWATLHVVGIAAAYGIVLMLKAETAAEARWLTTVSTVLIAGVFINALVARVRKEKLERLRLVERLEQMASTDELTGLPNRRACQAQLSVEMDRARREGRPLCVATIDLDRFKALNDARGHLAGDQLLKQLAALWSACLRSTDMLARYGGDEFVLLLSSCGVETARIVLDRLHAATPDAIAFSTGLVEWDRESDVEATIAASDARLYEAKRVAGERVVVAG